MGILSVSFLVESLYHSESISPIENCIPNEIFSCPSSKLNPFVAEMHVRPREERPERCIQISHRQTERPAGGKPVAGTAQTAQTSLLLQGNILISCGYKLEGVALLVTDPPRANLTTRQKPLICILSLYIAASFGPSMPI